MSKKGLSVKEIIKKISLTGDGQSGDSKGKKQIRFLNREMEGKNKHEQLALLKELFPNHPVWQEEDIPVERLPVK